MRIDPRIAMALILGAAFFSFLLSVSLWFGVFGEADRELGPFVVAFTGAFGLGMARFAELGSVEEAERLRRPSREDPPSA